LVEHFQKHDMGQAVGIERDVKNLTGEAAGDGLMV
jgi:hypothetical protein